LIPYKFRTWKVSWSFSITCIDDCYDRYILVKPSMSLCDSIEVYIERFYTKDESELKCEQSKPMDQNLIVVKSRSVMYDVEVMV